MINYINIFIKPPSYCFDMSACEGELISISNSEGITRHCQKKYILASWGQI